MVITASMSSQPGPGQGPVSIWRAGSTGNARKNDSTGILERSAWGFVGVAIGNGYRVGSPP